MDPTSSHRQAAHADESRTPFLEDVLLGLSTRPRTLPSKYFYDAVGSALFDRICELDEYYLTRSEIALMEQHVEEIADVIGPSALLVELGSGNSVKTQILLDHLPDLVAYIPVDISEAYLTEATERLRLRYPELEIRPLKADYTQPVRLPEPPRLPRATAVYYPGSTIGNFEPEEAVDFLRRLRPLCQAGGGILIGVDLKKDPAVITSAYNDSAGVTAAFNLNMLARINRELGANFDLEQFAHEAVYDEVHGRIEMRLRSLTEQRVIVGGQAFRFERDAFIRTEYSYKYNVDDVARLAASASLEIQHTWYDDQRLFSVHYLMPTAP